MPQQVTRLSYLMSRLGVRVKELSDKTGIDKTLISRWKNGRRKLSVHGKHLQKIMDHLFVCDKNKGHIPRTLQAYGLDASIGSERENLALWLSEQDIPTQVPRIIEESNPGKRYTASFSVFLGNEGLESAIITLLDYALSLPGPQNIISVMRGDYTWITNSLEFSDMLLDRLSRAFDSGTTLTVFNQNDFVPEEIYTFSGPWLAAHLHGYVKSCYYSAEEHSYTEKIMMVVKDRVCLKLTHDPAAPDNLYVGVFTDEFTVRQVYNTCLAYQRKSRTKFKDGFFPNPGAFLKSVPQPAALASPCYLFARVPSLGTIQVGDVYKHARLTKKVAREKAALLAPLFQTPDKCQDAPFIRHVYCADSIAQLCEPGLHKNAALSAIYGKRITHVPRLLKEQLQNIRHWIQTHKNYDAVFLPRRLFDEFPIEFISIDGHFMAAWLEGANRSTCLKDKRKNAALFNYAHSLWEKLPDMHKGNRSKKLKLLDGWIHSLEV